MLAGGAGRAVVGAAVTKRIDPDIKVLKACIRALDSSSSAQMLRANLELLVDRYARPGAWAQHRKRP